MKKDWIFPLLSDNFEEVLGEDQTLAFSTRIQMNHTGLKLKKY